METPDPAPRAQLRHRWRPALPVAQKRRVVSAPPVITHGMHPGSPPYKAEMAAHDGVVAAVGVVLQTPWAALIARAKVWAEQVRALTVKARDFHTTKDPRGQLWIDNNYEGKIAEHLAAGYFGTVCRWKPRDTPDEGWDFRLPCPGAYRVDVKRREAFLTLRDDELEKLPDYYALVQQRDAASPYLFLGVIRPVDFLREKFPITLGGVPMWAVTAACPAWITPAEFRRGVRAPRRQQP